MDRRAWWTTVHGVEKSWMWLNDKTTTTGEIQDWVSYGLMISGIYGPWAKACLPPALVNKVLLKYSHIIHLCIVHGCFHARMTEFSICDKKHVYLLVTQSCLTPLSMEFSRQEYWSGLPSLPPEDLSNPGINPRFPAFQADSLPSELPGKLRQKTMWPAKLKIFTLWHFTGKACCFLI